jgi:hypothetical protein
MALLVQVSIFFSPYPQPNFFPLFTTMGENFPFEFLDRKSSRKEEFSRLHISRIHGSARKELSNAVYLSACGEGAWRQERWPAHVTTIDCRLGLETRGKSRPGAPEALEPPSTNELRSAATQRDRAQNGRCVCMWYVNAHV